MTSDQNAPDFLEFTGFDRCFHSVEPVGVKTGRFGRNALPVTLAERGRR